MAQGKEVTGVWPPAAQYSLMTRIYEEINK